VSEPVSPIVLVIEDEPKLARLLADYLTADGFWPRCIDDGRAAVAEARKHEAALMLLDLMLPGQDGISVCREVRSFSAIPIIMVTARVHEIDRLLGLELGADDYICKPFSPREVVARVRAVLRRTGVDEGSSARLTFADLEMDDDTREVWRGSAAVELTATEYKLLRYLLLNARRVLSKAQILDHVWNYDFGGDAGVVETYISYLRKKIDSLGPPLIHTVRGVGYSLRMPRA